MALKRVSDFLKNSQPLELIDMPVPVPGEKEILVKVSRCGVCPTMFIRVDLFEFS